MKTLLILAALSATVPVTANDLAPETSIMVCSAFGQLAEVVMEHRQMELPLTEALAIAGDNGAARAIVMDAYVTASFRTLENQERAVREFRNRIETICYLEFQK